MKNILIIGSGAREQAIAESCQRSKEPINLFCVGNYHHPGIMPLCKAYVAHSLDDHAFIIEFAQKNQINFCIIGSEAPLEKGLADVLMQIGVFVMAPFKALARIETDKAFARELMNSYQIPGLPRFKVFKTLTGVAEFLNELGEDHYVIKASGLMGGKGVKVAGVHLHSYDEAIQYAETLLKDQAIVIEEKFIGQEFSAMCFTDGKYIVPMPIVQDHKRAFVDDKGPNTGGMGSYSDANHSLPFLTKRDVEQAFAINQQVITALFNETGIRYKGILYGSFIATSNGIGVIEFNARFGDPEALNVLSILTTDFVAIMEAIQNETLDQLPVTFAHQATVCKYSVPVGYPDQPKKNIPLNNDLLDEGFLYGAIDMVNDEVFAKGSRALAFVGIANTIYEAEKIAEAKMQKITGEFFHRPDIGTEQSLLNKIHMMQSLRVQ